MDLFSCDVDLARFEPGVFGDWYLRSQVLCGGDSGVVSGTQFTSSGVDFTVLPIEAGGCLWLESADGSIRGAYEILSVDDTSHLTVSVVRASSDQAAIPIVAALGLTWRIVSYRPQGYEVLWRISQKLGLAPGCAAADYDAADIVNAESLRQASVFGVLAMLFQLLQTGTEGQAVLREKLDYYERLYDEAMARVTVLVDTDGDGDAERTVQPGTVRLVRK